MKKNSIQNFIVLLFLIPFFIPSVVYSDGIYVSADRKHVMGEHTTLRLSKQQVKDVEQRRTITLSHRQWASLKRINKRISRTLPVLSSRWDSCTCGAGYYAIWCRPGEVDIQHAVIRDISDSEPQSEELLDSEDATATINPRQIAVVIDSKIDMYVNGRRVTETYIFRRMKHIADKKTTESSEKGLLTLDTPPPINDKADLKLKNLVNRFQVYCQSKGIDFWAIGLTHEAMEERIKTGK